jgi:uncharacterized protein with FMN-binding domain
MARKVNRRLLALGSAAIVSVYAVGFARTNGSAAPASAGLSLIPAATSGTATQPVDAATAIAQAIANGAPAVSAAAPATGAAATRPPAMTQTAAAAQAVTAPRPPAATQSAAAAYQDGTYTGSGTSRLGDIAVAVTVQGGQIASVRITNSTTHYSVSRIAQLPGEVLAKQSASIQLVSGATYSSNAFKQAVAQALVQASASVTSTSGVHG